MAGGAGSTALMVVAGVEALRCSALSKLSGYKETLFTHTVPRDVIPDSSITLHKGSEIEETVANDGSEIEETVANDGPLGPTKCEADQFCSMSTDVGFVKEYTESTNSQLDVS